MVPYVLRMILNRLYFGKKNDFNIKFYIKINVSNIVWRYYKNFRHIK